MNNKVALCFGAELSKCYQYYCLMFRIKGKLRKSLKIHVGVLVILLIDWTLYRIWQSGVMNMPIVAHCKQQDLYLVLFKDNSQLSLFLFIWKCVIGFDYCLFGLSQSLFSFSSFWNRMAIPRVSVSLLLQTQPPLTPTASMWNMSHSFFNGSTLSCQSFAPGGGCNQDPTPPADLLSCLGAVWAQRSSSQRASLPNTRLNYTTAPTFIYRFLK